MNESRLLGDNYLLKDYVEYYRYYVFKSVIQNNE